MSVGVIRKCVERAPEAIALHYERIAARARSAKDNHEDEAPWYQHEVLAWLWVMVDHAVAFSSVKASGSKAAFEELIVHWARVLVSDG